MKTPKLHTHLITWVVISRGYIRALLTFAGSYSSMRGPAFLEAARELLRLSGVPDLVPVPELAVRRAGMRAGVDCSTEDLQRV